MSALIHEEQVYAMAVGKAKVLADAYVTSGLPILKRILGEDAFVGFWAVELGGNMDELIQIWEFASEAERRRRRAELWLDAEWLAFAAEYGPLITHRSMRIFSPIEIRGEGIEP